MRTYSKLAQGREGSACDLSRDSVARRVHVYKKTARLSEQELDEAVAGAISEVFVLGLLHVVLNQASA